MHQTTVRFGRDLWDSISHEAGMAGVTVAQFVRDAALMRVVRMEAERDADFAEPVDTQPSRTAAMVHVAQAGDAAREEAEAATALWAQGVLARQRAQELRAESERRRAARRAP
jgi:hypothetical protein